MRTTDYFQPNCCVASVPHFLRQALVRLSESLAKMRLSAEVSAQDVQEALRLFKVSTMAAASAGSTAGDLGSLRPETQQEVRRAEDFLKRRIAVRSTVNRKKVRWENGRLGASGMCGGPRRVCTAFILCTFSVDHNRFAAAGPEHLALYYHLVPFWWGNTTGMC